MTISLNHRRSELHAGLVSVEEPEESWLLSYLDVFALIATLFIVLTVLAQLKLAQQQEQQQSQQQRLEQAESALQQSQTELAMLTTTDQHAIETLPASLQALLTEQSWQDQIVINEHDDFTEVQIRDHVLFASAEADLLPAGKTLLGRIVPVLAKTNGMIYVEGHTDDQPIATPRFHSNWELAAARATTVVRYFVDLGLPAKRLRAVSVADTDPVASNTDELGRAQNRRVSLLLRQIDTQPSRLTAQSVLAR